ncbi:MAG: nucleotidyltransferase family protein [Pyrinomonadaceae bacterium]|nr:nucleotidyltransferase family protein [Pyrinomonadaceae bacterium]
MSTQLKIDDSAYRRGEEMPVVEPAAAALTGRENNPAEVQLLLACARKVIDEATAERIRTLLRGSIDWSYVIERAERHRVTPLLCQNLNEVCPTLVPAEVLKVLRAYTSTNAHYNLYRTAELIKLLRLFEASGIHALPFKGPVLAALAYGNLGLRDFGDLDILVRPQDVLRTQGLLTGQGYRLISAPGPSLSELRFSPRNKDLIFDSANGRVRVELHWRFTGKHFDFPLEQNSMWKRLESVSIAGSVVRTLGPEELLLYLCMHGSRHGWERLLWICDVVELIRAHPAMDWPAIVEEASNLGSRRTLALGLIMARDLLGLELSPEVWRTIQVEPTTESLATRLQESLFINNETHKGISYWQDIHLRMRERVSDRVRLRLHYLRRYLRLAVVPNERDHAMLQVPSALPFLYYFLRPFRLIRKFGLPELQKRARGRDLGDSTTRDGGTA